MRTEPYSPSAGSAPDGRDDKRPHAVVVGSGFGGLASAVRLGARGYKVTVLDRLDKPGGRAYVFEQDGFRFDAGPTIITAPFLLEELWDLCGKTFSDHIDLRPMNPFYDIRFDDGSVFHYSGDAAAMEAEVARFNPTDVEGYRRFMAVSKQVYEFGFEKLGMKHFASILDMIKVVPKMLTLKGHRTVFGLVSSYIKDPKLRMVFSLHPLLIGANPTTVTAIYILINHLERQYGVHFAMGGTGSLVKGLVDLIEGQGNSIRCNADVAEIIVEQDRATGVRLQTGERISADIVVSNADSAWTYKHLLPNGRRDRWSDRKLERARYSNGLFVWYFGTNKRYEDVPHHMMLLGPRYEGLLKDIFGRKVLAKDFSLYLHRPTATDPSLAPDGCDTFYVLSPVPHLQADIDWTETAEPYRQAIEAHLSQTVLPGLGDHIISSRMMTPLDFQTRLLSYRGAGFGMEPVIWQSAWFRPNNISEQIDGLYLVGASTHPGAGIPGVLTSARVLDQVVPHADARV
jgi:phytoene desaturase